MGVSMMLPAILRVSSTNDDHVVGTLRVKGVSPTCLLLAVRRLRVSGGVVGLLLRGTRRAQCSLRSDGRAGGALGRAARVVSGQDDGPDAPAGERRRSVVVKLTV